MARIIHATLVGSVVIFAVVAHLVLRPSMADSTQLPPFTLHVVLGAALAACGLSFFLRGRIPRRSTQESADLFWTTASAPALVMWSVLEGAGLMSLVFYGLTGSPAAIAVVALAVLLLIILNPANLEKRV